VNGHGIVGACNQPRIAAKKNLRGRENQGRKNENTTVAASVLYDLVNGEPF